VSFTGAIAHSCNVAFMQMAERAGLDPLSAMGKRFGFGEKTGALGIDGESGGFLPDAAWIKRTKSPWQPGDTLQAGIGQANLLVTPLQSARAIAAIANGGQLVTLRLLKDSGGVPAAAPAPRDLRLAQEHRRRIEAGLRAVVGEGTAKQLDPTLQIAGKTGTAQNPGADHAWFVGYAPADRPRIAVAVLIEHGGHGGETAAPIAQAIIRAMLQPDGPPAA
jgi:penicillin-binding protein 2